MVKTTKTKKQAEESEEAFLNDVFDENQSQTRPAVLVTDKQGSTNKSATADGGNPVLFDDEYIDLTPKPKPRTFENENPQRERLINKIKNEHSIKSRALSQTPEIVEDGEVSPIHRGTQTFIEKGNSPFNFDILFKVVVLIILCVLCFMVGSGKLRSEVSTDISLNNSNPTINLNTNNTNPTTNTFYNNFTQEAKYTTNVQINATIQLPKEVLDDLKKIANVTNST